MYNITTVNLKTKKQNKKTFEDSALIIKKNKIETSTVVNNSLQKCQVN